MLIYLLRHGLTEYNAQKRYQGQRDIPLSSEGLAQLRRADIDPKVVYISTLQRTRQTAEVLFPDAELVPVDGLKEMCFGSFEGRNYIEMEHDPDYQAWVAANCESSCPDGERKDDFSDRVCRTFAALVDKALADGELDANYFQHTPYLESFNASNGTDLVSAAKIHYEPFGIYGNGVSDLSELAEGATIIIPADDSNETRALLLLQQEGLIKLPDDADAAKGVSTLDIVDDGGYNIVTVQADTVPAQLKNAAAGSIAVINGNYALAAGLKISDALASEDANGAAAQTYANIIAVRAGDENSPKTQALLKALKTDAVKQYIADTYNGAVVASF